MSSKCDKHYLFIPSGLTDPTLKKKRFKVTKPHLSPDPVEVIRGPSAHYPLKFWSVQTSEFQALSGPALHLTSTRRSATRQTRCHSAAPRPPVNRVSGETTGLGTGGLVKWKLKKNKKGLGHHCATLQPFRILRENANIVTSTNTFQLIISVRLHIFIYKVIFLARSLC